MKVYMAWKAKTISNKALTAAEKQNLAGDIKAVLAVLADINKIRFEVETLIATKNLEVRTEIAQVYEKLEEGVDHYEEFYKAYESINRKLLSTYKPLKPSQEEIQFQELYSIFFKIYMTTKLSLKYIREKDDEKLPKFISDLANGIQELSAFDFNTQGSTRLQNKKMLRARTDILRQAKSTLDKLKKFYNDGTVPVEFTDHGRYYFYYNSDVINNFNRYGNGVVFEMNRVFDNLDMPVLKFLEMPHYFKVLYPEEVIDTRPLAATNPNIKAAPENLKARKITPVTGKIIVDSLTFTIEIFDSKIKDGDVISFNYNKDWILNEQKLSDVAVKLRLKLNEDGKNFFILHSDDMGRNPPTTIGIRYKYGGEVKTIKLSSNLNTSEMIEIEYKPI